MYNGGPEEDDDNLVSSSGRDWAADLVKGAEPAWPMIAPFALFGPAEPETYDFWGTAPEDLSTPGRR